jgi:hypothetical protein
MTNDDNPLAERTLASIVEELCGIDETRYVIYADAGNGCGFGENGRAVEYDPAWGALVMHAIPFGTKSDDGLECTVASDWQDGDNGYRFRILF